MKERVSELWPPEEQKLKIHFYHLDCRILVESRRATRYRRSSSSWKVRRIVGQYCVGHCLLGGGIGFVFYKYQSRYIRQFTQFSPDPNEDDSPGEKSFTAVENAFALLNTD